MTVNIADLFREPDTDPLGAGPKFKPLHVPLGLLLSPATSEDRQYNTGESAEASWCLVGLVRGGRGCHLCTAILVAAISSSPVRSV